MVYDIFWNERFIGETPNIESMMVDNPITGKQYQINFQFLSIDSEVLKEFDQKGDLTIIFCNQGNPYVSKLSGQIHTVTQNQHNIELLFQGTLNLDDDAISQPISNEQYRENIQKIAEKVLKENVIKQMAEYLMNNLDFDKTITPDPILEEQARKKLARKITF